MTVEQDSHIDDVDNGVIARGIRWCAAHWLPILLAVLIIASAALTTAVYYVQFRPDQQTDDAAAHSAIKAASDGTVALLSYSPESLDRDFAAGRSHLTGDFLKYYSDFTQQIVLPAAQQKGLKTTANVVGAAVSELHPDTAVVLVFINQATMRKDNPEPALSASAVQVKLAKVKGTWLISSFDPVRPAP